MADVYEIAEEWSNTHVGGGGLRSEYAAKALARYVLATRAVVQAAVAQEEAYAKVRDADWGTVERNDMLFEAKRRASETGAAVRAMKEAERG